MNVLICIEVLIRKNVHALNIENSKESDMIKGAADMQVELFKRG